MQTIFASIAEFAMWMVDTPDTFEKSNKYIRFTLMDNQ